MSIVDISVKMDLTMSKHGRLFVPRDDFDKLAPEVGNTCTFTCGDESFDRKVSVQARTTNKILICLPCIRDLPIGTIVRLVGEKSKYDVVLPDGVIQNSQAVKNGGKESRAKLDAGRTDEAKEGVFRMPEEIPVVQAEKEIAAAKDKARVVVEERIRRRTGVPSEVLVPIEVNTGEMPKWGKDLQVLFADKSTEVVSAIEENTSALDTVANVMVKQLVPALRDWLEKNNKPAVVVREDNLVR
jgi:hypothetical protein